MSPDGTSIDQAIRHLGQTLKTQDPLSQKVYAGKRIEAPAEQQITETRVHRGRSVLRRLQAISANLNSVATKTRAADQIMDTIGKYIEQMKAQLERIIKNYPPFPPGSEERVKILRSYNSLRRQIDQMAFPSKDRGTTKAAAEPIVLTTTRNQEAVKGEIRTLSSRDFDIPEIPDTSTDREIAAAVKRLTDTEETFQKGRARLVTETLGISFSEVAGQKWTELQRGEQANVTDLSEGAAELKSRDLRRSLSTETTKNVIQSQLSFVNLTSESE